MVRVSKGADTVFVEESRLRCLPRWKLKRSPQNIRESLVLSGDVSTTEIICFCHVLLALNTPWVDMPVKANGPWDSKQNSKDAPLISTFPSLKSSKTSSSSIKLPPPPSPHSTLHSLHNINPKPTQPNKPNLIPSKRFTNPKILFHIYRQWI